MGQDPVEDMDVALETVPGVADLCRGGMDVSGDELDVLVSCHEDEWGTAVVQRMVVWHGE